MSVWKLANFLQTKSSENEEVRKEIENLEFEIERNHKLQKEEEDSIAEEFRLQMEVSKLQLIAEHIQEERERSEAMGRDLVDAYQSSVELREQLRRLDIEKLAAYEVMVNDMRHQKESLELQEQFRQKQELLKQMESRQIVQQLRAKQAAHQEVLKIHQQALEYQKNIKIEAGNKLSAKLNLRNKLILSLVMGSKELENMRDEINQASHQKQMIEKLQAKKKELTDELKRLQMSQKPLLTGTSGTGTTSFTGKENVFKVPETNPSKRTENPSRFDPFNPMAFFKSIKLDFNMGHAMQDFYIDWKVKNQEKEDERNALKLKNLRPILRNSTSSTTKPVNNVKGSTRHVSFVEPDSSCPSSPSDSSYCINNTFTLENTSQNNEDVSTGTDMNEDVKPTNETVENQAVNSMTSAAQVQECIVIKPPGTALPKVIPFDLSSSTVTMTTSNIPSESNASNTESSADKLFYNQACGSTYSLSVRPSQSKQRNILDFDSLYTSNKSSDTEDEDLLQPTVNTDTLMFDFGSTDQLENENGDNDKYLLDFSDDSLAEGSNFL